MSRLLLATLALTLTTGSALAQSAPTPEDVVLAAMDACVASDGGRSIANATPRLGFRPSTTDAGRFVRTLPGVEVQIWVESDPQTAARPMHLCTVAVWGRLSDEKRITDDLLSRARVGGFTIKPEEPRDGGGVTQMMHHIDGEKFRGFNRAFMPGGDTKKGGSYALSYGWID